MELDQALKYSPYYLERIKETNSNPFWLDVFCLIMLNFDYKLILHGTKRVQWMLVT